MDLAGGYVKCVSLFLNLFTIFLGPVTYNHTLQLCLLNPYISFCSILMLLTLKAGTTYSSAASTQNFTYLCFPIMSAHVPASFCACLFSYLGLVAVDKH